jgi:hypothetical protein
VSSISSQASADSASDSKGPGCEPSRSARLSHTQEQSSKSTGPTSHAMTTCEPSPLTALEQTELFPMSSVAASRAKTSVLQAPVQALKASAAAYGRNIGVLLARLDRTTSSWKTWQCSLVEDLELFSETWPRSGTMQNGIASQLPPLAPITKETESGFWPTPVRLYTRENWTAEQLETKQAQVKADTLAKGKHHTGNGFGLNLAQAVRLWPTPTKRDWRSGSKAHWERRHGTRNLNDKVALEGNGGLLNPTWVEWLMGFPVGWTELAPSEMPSSPRSRKLSGKL